MKKSAYVSLEYKEDPLGFLIKLMDLKAFSEELKKIDNGLYILTGLITFRSLNHLDKQRINAAIQGIPRGRLLARLAPMTASITANPYWFSWSLSDEELRAYYKLNSNFAGAIEMLGLDMNLLSVAGLAGVLLAVTEPGVTSVISKKINNNLASSASKRFGLSGVAVQRAGIAGAIVTVFAGTMHMLSATSANDAKRELASRGLLKLEDF